MKYYVYAVAKTVEKLFEKINPLVGFGFQPFGTVYSDDYGFLYQTFFAIVPKGKTAEDALIAFHKDYPWAVDENKPDDSISGEEKDDLGWTLTDYKKLQEIFGTSLNWEKLKLLLRYDDKKKKNDNPEGDPGYLPGAA